MKNKTPLIAFLVVVFSFYLPNLSYSADGDDASVLNSTNRDNLPQILQALEEGIVDKNSKLQEDMKKLIDANRELSQRYDDVVDKNISINQELAKEISAKKELQQKLNAQTVSNQRLSAKEQELEQQINELLSSDVDIWQVIANKARVLKEFKDNVIRNTREKITVLEQSLNKARLKIQNKRQELDLAKNKFLAKQADKNRELSQLVDAKTLEITTNLDVVRGEIEKLRKEYQSQLLEKTQLLDILKANYDSKLDENNREKAAVFEQIERGFEEELTAFNVLLDRDNATVEPLEKERQELIIDYDKKSGQLTKDYNTNITDINQNLAKLESDHEFFMSKSKTTFEVLSDDFEIKVKDSETKLKEVESYIASINKTAEQRLTVLKRGEELRHQDFINKQSHLEARIKEIDQAAQEVAENNEDRAYVLNVRKQEVERKMQSASAELMPVLQVELDIINKQMKALEDIFASVSTANDNVKSAFTSTLLAQQKSDEQETLKYQKEYAVVDERRNSIISEESQRLEKLRLQSEKDISDYEQARIEYKQKTETAAANFSDTKSSLERELVNVKSEFDAQQNRMKSDYDTRLAELNDRIEKNSARRKEILTKKESIVALTELEKSKKIRNFDLVEQRIKSVYADDKRAVELDINTIKELFDKKDIVLKKRENALLADKRSNEESYQRKKNQLLESKQKTLDDIRVVEDDVNQLEETIEKESLEQIAQLAKLRDASVDRFETSLTNLEQAQLAFEDFTDAQQDLQSGQRNSGEVIDTIMRNFRKITGEPFNEFNEIKPLAQPKKNTGAKKSRSVDNALSNISLNGILDSHVEEKAANSSDTQLSVLEDITNNTQVSSTGDYKSIRGGCYAPDILEDSETADQVQNVCVDGFSISAHEVSNADYRRYKKDHDSGDFKGYSVNADNMPVVNVSWLDAVAYAQWLSETTGEVYRLPTDEEWEYAARGGSAGKAFYPNEQSACFYANIADQSVIADNPTWEVHDCIDGETVSSDVGSYKPNDYGLYDMLGNVWEWTCPQYETLESGEIVCSGINAPESDLKIARGGSWFSSPKSVRFGFKYGNNANFKGKHIGFRLVKGGQQGG